MLPICASPVQQTQSRDVLILACATLACLIPFSGKAFHIDDPVYVRAAQQILSHPADFYGFRMNWRGTEMLVADFQQNPPGVSYLLAVAGLCFGWSERALHLALLFPAVAAVIGIYFLAQGYCSSPLLAALLSLLTPSFWVSSTTVMSDVTMLAFWVWALVFWTRGLRQGRWWMLLVSSILIGLCALTKYFGVCLIPLLFAGSLAWRRRLGSWALFLLIPALMVAGYQWAGYCLYGRALFGEALRYASSRQPTGGLSTLARLLTALSFAGGCISAAAFYAHELWTRRTLVVGTAFAMLATLAVILIVDQGALALWTEGENRWAFLLQFSFLVAVGAQLLWLAVLDFLNRKDAASALLFLWMAGTFVFAALLNWAITARTFLPIVPAAVIILLRRLEQRNLEALRLPSARALGPLLATALLGFTVAFADYTLAGSGREAANALNLEYRDKQMWFQGHWGFQYYMEQLGATGFDVLNSKPAPGELMVVPVNNTNLFWPRKETVRIVKLLQFQTCSWLSTMHPAVRAGFYANSAGPLPFAFGNVPPEEYYVFSVVQPLRLGE
ncbi:MAG: glycosyltransferase family 39 protein [Acidobacteria bacterium]|nr:glycosyltransferase family 39 protein [Acidobacteriota bacterium]MCI0621977.1 glycosyltransferase family 39 protein [Acidobacteriota bacterium]MCI0721171.1 glycosyltransferase family 39 protein [Acidobacteriota bacterium]